MTMPHRLEPPDLAEELRRVKEDEQLILRHAYDVLKDYDPELAENFRIIEGLPGE